MGFKNFFWAALALSQVVSPFVIPEGQPDGTYLVTYDPLTNHETHTLLNPLPPLSTVSLHPRPIRRQITGGNNDVFCGTGRLDSQDTDLANGQLDAQCGGGFRVAGNRDVYSIVGCTVAYFCNLRATQDTCFANERATTSAAVTRVCGVYQAGWNVFDAGTSGRRNQYGYEDVCRAPGNNFCGRGP